MANENRQVAPIDDFRGQLAHKDTYQQILNYFGGDEEITRKFVSSAVHVVRKVPDLLTCDRHTLMEALIACAEVKLFPSAVSGEAYILPYKGKAQFQLGYQGIITLLYRAGVSSITSNIVYEKDTFHYQEGLHAILDHIPAPLGVTRGEAMGVYAIATVNGEKLFKVMSKEEVMKFKGFSQGAGSKFSPWDPKNDPELHMWRKTCIKQLAKTLPKNESLITAIARDNEESTIAALPEKRAIDTAALKEAAPTMGKLKAKKDAHGKKEKGDEGQNDLGFGIAKDSAEE